MAKINWYPGHMQRSKRALEPYVQNSDLIIEVRDARAPLASRSIYEFPSEKRLFVLLNKADLADQKISQQWLEFFKKKDTQDIFLLSPEKKNFHKFITKLQKFSDGGKKKGLRSQPYQALIVGVPNVGKSRLINALIGQGKRLKVENRAGVTQSIERVQMTPYLTLFDSPGVLEPNLCDQSQALSLAFIGAIKEQILPHDHVVKALFETLSAYYPQVLKTYLKLSKNNPLEQLNELASRWNLNYEQILRRLLKKISNGDLGRLSFEIPSS